MIIEIKVSKNKSFTASSGCWGVGGSDESSC